MCSKIRCDWHCRKFLGIFLKTKQNLIRRKQVSPTSIMNMVLGAAAATAAAAFGPQLQTVERCSTYNDFVSPDGRDRR